MYSIIRQLRHNGHRRSDHEFANDPGIGGRIQVVRVGGYIRISLSRWGDNSPNAELLPPLYDAYCETWIGDQMTWRGHQRANDKAPTYLQEWVVRIIREYPPSGSSDIAPQMRSN